MKLYNYVEYIKESKVSISDIIRQLGSEYMSNHKCSLWDINNGWCEAFADDVANKINDPNLTVLSGHMIFDASNPDFALENWDGELVDTDYGVWSINMLNLYGYPEYNGHKIDLNIISDGLYHDWVYYEGKHYDAECPEGVTNWSYLPIFERKFKQYI